MTREEAIEYLKRADTTVGKTIKTRTAEALEMAIEALQTEQNAYKEGYDACKRIMAREKQFNSYCPKCMGKLEPCDDCISRSELLKAIDTWDKFGVDDTNSLFRLDNLSLPHYVPYIHYDDVVKCIKGMPPVTIKNKEEKK